MEARRAIEVGGSLEQRVVENMPPTGAVIRDEVQVRSDHLDPIECVGKTEPHQRARHVDKIGNVLSSDHVGEGGIRDALLGDRAHAQRSEAAVDTDRRWTRLPIEDGRITRGRRCSRGVRS